MKTTKFVLKSSLIKRENKKKKKNNNKLKGSPGQSRWCQYQVLVRHCCPHSQSCKWPLTATYIGKALLFHTKHDTINHSVSNSLFIFTPFLPHLTATASIIISFPHTFHRTLILSLSLSLSPFFCMDHPHPAEWSRGVFGPILHHVRSSSKNPSRIFLVFFSFLCARIVELSFWFAEFGDAFELRYMIMFLWCSGGSCEQRS